jgi:pyruvate/2-oxoglutarate dehydrogenase complex dihydrolipoamide dehydrogenase (E3) component
MQSDHYEAVIIGSGQGGTPLARELATAGRKTALVERAHAGGTCVNVGCTPTKTMVSSAEAADWARRAVDYGVRVGDVSVDMEAVRRRKREMVRDFRSAARRSLEKTENLDLIDGDAHFTGPKALEVRLNDCGERRLTADLVFIDVGGRPRIPSLDGLHGVPHLDSTSVMELDHVPAHLLVLGGGYEAMEFSQMFRRFGSAVTVIQKSDRLMNREDEDVSDAMRRMLEEDGVAVLLNGTAKRVEPAGEGVRLDVQTRDGERRLEGSHLLVCVGRTPNTDTLNAQAAGVEQDERGYITVNDRLETSAPGVYAIGDVTGGPAFTHISYDDFRVLRENILRGGEASISARLVPYVVFTDPQLGRVGLTEAQAREQGKNVRVAKIAMDRVARGLETGRTRGFMKAVVDEDSKQILGCAMLCMEGGEVMSALEIAMMGGLPYTAIKEGVFAHPTLAESLNNLFMTLD